MPGFAFPAAVLATASRDYASAAQMSDLARETDTAALAAELERLKAERDIYALLTRYCRGQDRLDLEMVRSCYHPDAHDNHGGRNDDDAYQGGVDGLLAWMHRHVSYGAIGQHFIGNFTVDVQGDVAFSEAYIHSASRRRDQMDKPTMSLIYVRFYDRVERRDGEHWKIARRDIVWDSAQVVPNPDDSWTPPSPPSLAGRRSDDPSVELAAAWREETDSDAPWLGI